MNLTCEDRVRLASTGASPSLEDALALARRLERLLLVLPGEGRSSEHFELRLARALAGNLTDQLEAVANRRSRSNRSEARS